MADDSSITVQIDANTEGLDEGIARAKDAADSFVAHIKDVAGALSQMGDVASDADTAANSDCGKRIVFNTNTLLTLTLNTGSGYPANCDITVSNVGVYTGTGSARGIILSVSDIAMASQNNVLYPGQTTVFSNSGASSVWVETGYGQRELWKPNALVTFYADATNGSDTAADGLGPLGGANLTLDGLYKRFFRYVDYSGIAAQATLSTTGAFTTSADNFHLSGVLRGSAGNALLLWNGNGTTTLTASNGSPCAALFDGASIEIDGVSCQSTDTTPCFSVTTGARIFFITAPSTCNPNQGSGFVATNFGYMEFVNVGLSFGSAAGLSSVISMFSAQGGGTIQFDAPETITFLGNTTFTQADIVDLNGSNVSIGSSTFNTGGFTVSGPRFQCAGYSTLGAGSSPNTTIPGSSNGTIGPDCQSNSAVGITPIANGGTGYAAAPARSTFKSISAGGLSAISSTSYEQLGIKGSIAPTTSGNILVIVTAEWYDNTPGDTCTAVVSYGTGIAPGNGAAASGTQIGAPLRNQAGGGYQSSAWMAYITGLTAGTAYWLDLQVKTSSTENCQFGGLNLEAIEE